MKIKEPYGFIYITTNMIDGKRYIGQRKFYGNWWLYLGSGKFLKKDLKKYGRENFYRDIVGIAYSKEELDLLEIKWIKNYNAVKSDDFYNIAEGGHNNPFAGKSDEEIQEIINKRVLKNTGKKRTIEQRRRISDANKGKKLSEETKKKIGKAHKGRVYSEETLKKMGDAQPKTKVICLTTNEIFDSIKQASKYYNICHTSIIKCCINKNTYGGKLSNGEKLVWMYYEDYINATIEEIDKRKSYINSKKKHSPSFIKVICLTTNEIFDSIAEASEYYNLQTSHISSCCKGNRKHCGRDKNGNKLIWLYYDKYLSMNENEIKEYIESVNIDLTKGKYNKKSTKVICITTKMIFDSMAEAGEYYKIKSFNNISQCCSGKIKNCGKLDDGTLLTWMYYEDYLKENS